ncbi:MAG: DUF523 domain-containing protein [Candidatus Omnitrophica bacterium]|nr:DUF523 domain-containing protein [Candidatus Omnitrophota bacterium]
MDAPADKKSRIKVRHKYLVSACLAGINCTYNGKNKLRHVIRRMVEDGIAVPVCPESLGGGSIPRFKCEISGGDGGDVLDKKAKVLTPCGKDVSKILIAGARKALAIARKYGLDKAIMKSKSPSCGCGYIYDGTFSRKLVKGDGVTTSLLRRNKIRIYTDTDRKYA